MAQAYTTTQMIGNGLLPDPAKIWKTDPSRHAQHERNGSLPRVLNKLTIMELLHMRGNIQDAGKAQLQELFTYNTK
jgi:hypothetical protein